MVATTLRSAYLPYSYVRKDCAHRDAKTSAPPMVIGTGTAVTQVSYPYTVVTLVQ